MNVNERIVNCWLNNCRNMFTICSVNYNPAALANSPAEVDPAAASPEIDDLLAPAKTGKYHSDIDLLAVSLQGTAPVLWNIEVKLRTGGIRVKMNDSKQNGFYHICGQLLDKNRADCLHRIAPACANIENYLVTNRKFLNTRETKTDPDYWTRQFAERGIRILYFEDIIADLQRHAADLALSNDDTLQILRLEQFFSHP